MRVRINLQYKDPAERDKALKQFSDSYVKKNETYFNYSVRWDKMPTIGADCDTFEGNSGSPVFDKVRHRVIGVLIAGEPDVETPWMPGWIRHEAILPITEIVKDISTNFPELLNHKMRIVEK